MLKIQHNLNFICKFSELAYLLLVEVSKFLMAITHNEEEGGEGEITPHARCSQHWELHY